MNNQAREGWLNKTVVVGNNDFSFATIILVALGAVMAFGTTWLSGLMSWLGISTVLTLAALFIAYQNRQLGLVESIMTFITFFVIFKVSLWFLTAVLPTTITNNDMSGWEGLASGYRENMPMAANAHEDLLTPLLDGETQYTFTEATSTPVTISPAMPVPQAPALPAITATPDAIVPLLYDLNTAVANGDRVGARTAAEAILRAEPTNERATAVLEQIEADEATLAGKRAMPTTPTVRIQDGEAEYVQQVLAGGTYLIVKDNASLTNFACQEISVIEETGGFLQGEQYRVKRCLLDQFGVGSTGDEFAVQGR